MADSSFFVKAGAIRLADIIDTIADDLVRQVDVDDAGSVFVEDVASLDKAGKNDISFLDNIKYREDFEKTKAGFCIVPEKMVEYAPDGCVLLVSDNPYRSYALVAQKFYPPEKKKPQISEDAFIGLNAKIGDGCYIAPNAVVEEGASIGSNCEVASCAVIGRNVVIGDDCVIGAGASISHAIIGSGVRIYPGVCIGQDGFGFALDTKAGRHVKVPQLGRVIIEDNVEIGANSTIDRGAGPDTVIGSGTWIDNLVQIAHNVKIGKGCVIIAQSGIAGSSVMEDFSILAAQAGVAGHLKIGAGAQIGAKSGVMRNVPAGEKQLGIPAMPAKSFMRQVAALKKLSEKK